MPIRVNAKVMVMLGLSLCLAVGCATAPTQEMSDARQALHAAREAEASIHAPASLARAEAFLVQAERALRAGDFEGAKGSAVSARSEAVKARNIATVVDRAKGLFAKAEQSGCACDHIRDLIEKAERAIQRGDEDRALELANEAARQSELVLKQKRTP